MPTQGLWHFRVHFGTYKPEDVMSFIKDRAEVVIAVKEIDSNRPHIHSVITEFKQTKSTFVQQFLKEFPDLAGNGNYSCSKKNDILAQIRYCSKGESKETMPEVLYHQPGLDIKFHHDQYWEENSLLKAKSKEGNMGSQKDTSLVSKPKSKTWTEKVFDEMQQLYPEHVISVQTFQLLYKPTDYENKAHLDSKQILFRYMMKRLGVQAKKFDNRMLEQMFNGFINGIIQLNTEAGDKYSDKIFNLIYN